MWSGHWNSCSFIPLGFACDLLSELVWLCVSMSICGFHIFRLRLLLWETNHVRYWSLGWVCDRCWDYGFIPVCWIPHGNWTIWMTLRFIWAFIFVLSRISLLLMKVALVGSHVDFMIPYWTYAYNHFIRYWWRNEEEKSDYFSSDPLFPFAVSLVPT